MSQGDDWFVVDDDEPGIGGQGVADDEVRVDCRRGTDDEHEIGRLRQPPTFGDGMSTMSRELMDTGALEP